MNRLSQIIYKCIIAISLVCILFSAEYIHAQNIVTNNPEWGLWQHREDSVITFDLIQVYGTDFPDESAVFSSVNGIWTVDSDEYGNIYVLDNDAPMLVKFSTAGEVMWKIERKGKGPGDLYVPNGLAVGKKIYISNQIGARIDVFDKKGKFLRTLKTDNVDEKQRSVIGIIENRYLVLGTSKIPGKIGMEFTILDIKNKYQKVSEFKATEEIEFEIPGTGWIYPKTSIVDGFIVITKSFNYGFKYFRIDGTLVKEINRDASKYMRPGFGNIGNRNMMMSLSKVYAQHKIEGGYLLNFVSWPTNIDDPDRAVSQMGKGNFPELKSQSSLDLYSPNGNLLYSVERMGLIPEIGWIKHSDDVGYLYTVVGNPYPQVRKYKVNISD